jgi:hypothetical protein
MPQMSTDIIVQTNTFASSLYLSFLTHWPHVGHLVIDAGVRGTGSAGAAVF